MLLHVVWCVTATVWHVASTAGAHHQRLVHTEKFELVQVSSKALQGCRTVGRCSQNGTVNTQASDRPTQGVGRSNLWSPDVYTAAPPDGTAALRDAGKVASDAMPADGSKPCTGDALQADTSRAGLETDHAAHKGPFSDVGAAASSESSCCNMAGSEAAQSAPAPHATAERLKLGDAASRRDSAWTQHGRANALHSDAFSALAEQASASENSVNAAQEPAAAPPTPLDTAEHGGMVKLAERVKPRGLRARALRAPKRRVRRAAYSKGCTHLAAVAELARGSGEDAHVSKDLPTLLTVLDACAMEEVNCFTEVSCGAEQVGTAQ